MQIDVHAHIVDRDHIGSPTALRNLTAMTGERSLAGVAVGSNIGGTTLDEPVLEPIRARIDELRLPGFEHPVFPVNTAGMDAFD